MLATVLACVCVAPPAGPAGQPPAHRPSSSLGVQAAPDRAPLATVVVLTCNRPQYVLLALRQIAAQDYHPLEALVVDDGTAQLSPLLRATYPALEIVPAAMQRPAVAGPAATGANATDAGDGLSVRLLSLPRHVSIGEKRALASRAARGEVILHWDDDDFHEPSRVSAQVAPIARGAADVTALELSHMVAMPSMAIYATPPGRRIPLFSSLAYRASLGRELSFLNVSLAEDVDFAERAVQATPPIPLPPSLPSPSPHPCLSRSRLATASKWCGVSRPSTPGTRAPASPTPTASRCSACCARVGSSRSRRRRGWRPTS